MVASAEFVPVIRLNISRLGVYFCIEMSGKALAAGNKSQRFSCKNRRLAPCRSRDRRQSRCCLHSWSPVSREWLGCFDEAFDFCEGLNGFVLQGGSVVREPAELVAMGRQIVFVLFFADEKIICGEIPF